MERIGLYESTVPNSNSHEVESGRDRLELPEYEKRLYHESLHTLLVKVGAILNSKLMTTGMISDVKSDIFFQLTNLMTMKSKVIFPPPG